MLTAPLTLLVEEPWPKLETESMGTPWNPYTLLGCPKKLVEG